MLHEHGLKLGAPFILQYMKLVVSKRYSLMYNGHTTKNLKPITTWHGLQVLSNSLFVGLSKAQRVQSEREQSAHQIWSSDFKSQMSNALDSLDSVDIINV